MYIITLKADNGGGDVATVMFNKKHQPLYAMTLWNIEPFIALLNKHFPPPPGCEWRKISLLIAKIVQR